ncbi:hypothetical protein HQ520_09560 [bacterium]|nr:hypothetical protein [bacterium]
MQELSARSSFLSSPRWMALLVGLALLLPRIAMAQIEVTAEVSDREILAGEPLEVRLTVRWQPAMKVQPFQQPKDLAGFEFLSIETSPDQPVSGTDRRERVITLGLTTFEFGEQTLPEFEIVYTEGSETRAEGISAGTIEVKPVLAPPVEGETPQARPVRPPLAISLRPSDFLIPAGLLFLGLFLVGVLVWGIRRRKPRRTRPETVRSLLPPDVEALHALAALETEDAARRDPVKFFYTRLSDILRRYLGRRYGFDALEMTSWELTEQIGRLGWSVGLFELLARDLSESDSVKFARYAPPVPNRLEAIERVRRIVRETKPAPVVETPEEAKEATFS